MNPVDDFLNDKPKVTLEVPVENRDKRDALGRFLAGRHMGRPPGCKSKFNTVKAMVLQVLEDLGGPDWIYAFAQDHPKDFLKLIEKLMPEHLEVSGPDGQSISINTKEMLLKKITELNEDK